MPAAAAAAAVAVRPTASVDGVVTSLEEGRVPLTDRGFLYGDSVYEVFRTYEGVPLFWEEHFDRLKNSARLIHMPITQSRDEMMDGIRRAVGEAGGGPSDDGSGEVYVRFHVSRGVGPIDLYPDPELRTSFMVIVKPVPAWKQEHYDVGLRVAVPSVRRNAIDAMSPNIKSGNYLNNVMGVAEAAELGADDCLFLNAAGHVAESSNSNVFFVREGQVVTPADSVGNLRGLTGAALRKIAAAIDLPIAEVEIPAEALPSVEEAFVTSATREVMPVATIRTADGAWHELPAGGGPITRRLAQEYRDHVTEYVAAQAAARLW